MTDTTEIPMNGLKIVTTSYEFGHGGHINRLALEAGLKPDQVLDFSANINPLGPPEWFRPLISSRLSSLVHYPDPECSPLVEAIAGHYGTDPREIAVGNGSTELLYLLPQALPFTKALIAVPAYIDYARAAQIAGLPIEWHSLTESEGFRLDPYRLEGRLSGGELVILGQPNNPTGLTFDPQALRALAGRYPETCFLIDEAFADFVEGVDSLTRERPANVIVLLSFTKFYAVPGLRLGSALLAPDWARKVQKLRPPWTVNTLAQEFGTAALRDIEYGRATRAYVREQRLLLTRALRAIPCLTVYPGEANFLFLRSDHPVLNAAEMARKLLAEGIGIRVCGNYQGLDDRYFRVAVRTESENQRLAEALKAILAGKKIIPVKRPKIPALMFQGTGSNAGKSFLTAALCRILLQDGYRVAPFSPRTCP